MLCICDRGLLAITMCARIHWMVVIHVIVTSFVSVIGVISQYMWEVGCQEQVSQAGIRNCIPQKFCEINDTYIILWDTISYPLFADAHVGIYPHAASQYHARPKAKPNSVTLCLFSSKSSSYDKRPAAIGVSFEFKAWPMFELDSFWLLCNTILHWAVVNSEHMKYVDRCIDI